MIGGLLRRLHVGRLRLVLASGILTLISLSLMAWSVLDPRPLAVVAAMTFGQGIGTLALALFGLAVLLDLRRHAVLDDPDRDRDGTPPTGR